MSKEDFEDHVQGLFDAIADLRELGDYHLDDLREWDRGEGKFQRAAELVRYHRMMKQMLEDLEKIEVTFATIRDDLAGSDDSNDIDEKSRLRLINVTVTEGMIRNSMLTLSAAVRAGTLKLGESLSIRTPRGTTFETIVKRPGNRLQERRHIREFYEEEEVSAGDTVVLKEKEPGVWALSKMPPLNMDELAL